MKFALAALWLIGGICCATAILLAITGGFGVEGGDVALMFPKLGFDGNDQVQIFGQGKLAIGLMLLGVGCLAGANSQAWKETGGY
jgi:hypothetical protein